MNERREMCRALPIRLGLLLLAVVAFANGCASEDVVGQSGDPSSGEAPEDLQNRTTKSIYTCTIAQGLVLGSLEVVTSHGDRPTCKIFASEQPRSSRGFCFHAPGDTPPFTGTCPECEALRVSLGCAMAP